MKRFYMLITVSTFLTAFFLAPAQAGVIPGQWEMVQSLEKETPVAVILRSGDRLEGKIRGLEPEALFLDVGRNETTPIPRQSVQRISVMRQVDDKPWNGAAIGALCGVAAFVAIHALAYSEEPAPTHAQDALLFPLAGGGGFAVGYLLDKSRKGSATEERTVYQAMP